MVSIALIGELGAIKPCTCILYGLWFSDRQLLVKLSQEFMCLYIANCNQNNKKLTTYICRCEYKGEQEPAYKCGHAL